MDLVRILHFNIAVIVLLLASNASGVDSSNFTVLTSQQSHCIFPIFLQTKCTSRSRVCGWHFGERIALPLEEQSSPPSKFRSVRGTTQWSWKVVNGSIFVKYLLQKPFRYQTKTITERYDCIKKYAESNHTFLISKTSLKELKPQSLNKFNCIRFFKRSETVLEYKLGPWVSDISLISCLDNNTVFEKYPLISDRYYGQEDCPSELKGGFEILNIYDSFRQRHCHYRKGTDGILEADCLNKEGLVIDFGKTHNCSSPYLGFSYPHELRLRCHSKPWSEGNMTFVVTSQRPRWAHEYKKTTFQCLMFDSTHGNDEFNLYISNKGTCERSLNNKLYIKDKQDVYVLRIRRGKAIVKSSIEQGRCTFPAEIQGEWLEDSTHTQTERIKITEHNMLFNSGESYKCFERFIFKYKHYGCGLSRGTDRWPLQGRLNFYHDDYTVISRFENGCRPRVSRLGISNTVDNNILAYRLSHGEPIVDDGGSLQQDYDHEILTRLCGMTYLYQQDPYPYWGRNIEKIIHRERLDSKPMNECSLVFNSRHNLISTVAVTESTSCPGSETRLHFGCPEPYSTSKYLKIVYNKQCYQKNEKLQCIGKAWKFGRFILLRDVVTQSLTCIWLDKKNNAILRLRSSQCFDVDWGQVPGHGNQFGEVMHIKYFERCPHAPDPTIRAVVIHNNALSVCHNLWITLFLLFLSNLPLFSFK